MKSDLRNYIIAYSGDSMYNWLELYLSGRIYITKVNGVHSTNVIRHLGTAQGSV